MEKYEPLGVVGEGSYGVVLKCRNRESGRSVAIKKFIDSEDDQNVRKIALREIRVLRKLHHENLVNLLEVFRRRKHLYLVFEFIDHTLLDEMENKSNGLDGEICRKYVYQILRGLGFCHDNQIIHRDVKPENVLVSKNGIVKLCDFGFARNLCAPGEQYTDYVATRWYRAPELLVGDVSYGKEVDIWAVGCLFSEMMSGEPLFPGDSDIDQLFLIAQCLGRLARRHVNIMARNSAFRGFQFPKSRQGSTASSDSMGKPKLAKLSSVGARSSGGSKKSSRLTSVDKSVFSDMFPSWSDDAVHFLTLCLDPEPPKRPGCNALLRLPYFTHDSFPSRFINELNLKLQLEGRNPIPAYSMRKKRSVLGGANVTSSTNGNSPAAALMKKNPLYQTRTNLNLVNDSMPTKDAKVGISVGENSPQKLFSRDQTFLVDRTPATKIDKIPPPQRKGSFALSSNLLNTNGNGNDDISRIPTLAFGRKNSDESLVSKIPYSNFSYRSNPNINEDSQVSQVLPLFTQKDKRFSMPQEQVKSNGTNPPPPRKFSYSFPPPLESQNSLEEKHSGGQEKLFHTLPVTTLTFSLGPPPPSSLLTGVGAGNGLVSVRSPNFQSFQLNKRTPSPTKTSNKENSSYFPQTASRVPVSFYTAGSNTKSLPVSVFGSSMLHQVGSSSGKRQEIGSTGGEGFLPRMTTKNFTPSGNSIKEDELGNLSTIGKPGLVSSLNRKRDQQFKSNIVTKPINKHIGGGGGDQISFFGGQNNNGSQRHFSTYGTQ